MSNNGRYAVLGLGQFGTALARELTKLGAEVLAVDVSAKRVEAVRDDVASAATADIRDRDTMNPYPASPRRRPWSHRRSLVLNGRCLGRR